MPSRIQTPFSEFIEVLQNMPYEQKKKLIDNYKAFGTLKSLCVAKGWVEIIPPMKGIRVLKDTPEVKELKKVIDVLKPGGFTWEEKKKSLLKDK